MTKGRAGKAGRAGGAAPAARKGGAAARAVPPAQSKRTADARRGGTAAPQAAGRQAHAPAVVASPGEPPYFPDRPDAVKQREFRENAKDARRQAVAANTAALAAQPQRVMMQKVPVDSSAPHLPWKVVLTRLVGEFADETAARVLFAAESRVLAPGERLTIIKDGRT